MMRRVVSALLALGLLALLLWFRSHDEAVLPVSPATIPSRSPEARSAASVVAERLPADAPPALSGTVRDESGAAIPGALLHWSCLEREDLDETPSWAFEALEPAPKVSSETRADEQGRYAFAGPPCASLEFGTVLVASAPGFLPRGQLVASKSGSLEVVLLRGRTVSVRVSDGRGNPVQGATVSHYDCALRAGGRLRPVEERALSETAVTDSEGRVTFVAFPGEQAFLARHERSSSQPWKGSRPEQVELVLAPSFSVRGSVAYPDRDQWEPEYEGERRVEVACRQDGTWRLLAVQRNLEDEFHLASIPIVERASLYRVRLAGAPVLTDDRFFAPPREGDALAFQFSAQKGGGLFLFVDDESGNPVTTATARLDWEVEGTASRQAYGASRQDGYLYAGTFPPGTVRFQVEAPGFSPHVGIFNLPVDESIWITLRRSQALRGVCREEGVPARAFELIYWRNEAPEMRARQAFRDAEGGAFELELAPGTWLIQAASSTHPACEPVVVDLPAQASERLELDLLAGLLGDGVVRDAQSGEPVEGALVQAYSGDGRDRTLRWGEPALTRADGSFQLAAFVTGSNTITVNAAGFAEALVAKHSNDEGRVDWGEIRLVRPQDLELELRGAQESLSPAPNWWAHTLRGFALPVRHFDAAGRLTFSNVPPGDHRVYVQDRQGAYVRLNLGLKTGERWSYSVGVGGPKRLTVRLLEEDGTLHPDPVQIYVGGTEDGNYVLRENERPEDGLYHFAGIATDALDVSATTFEGQDIASQQVSLAGHDALQVDLVIDRAPLRVRVVDPAGNPLPAVRVRVRALDENRVLVLDQTATDGWANLPGVPREACLVDAMHASGMRLAVPIDASLREQELVLEPSGSVTLVLKDDDVALAGVTTRLQTPDGTSLATPMDTDADGTARREGLGAGTYTIFCTRADCWPTSVRHTLATGEAATVEVPMRRLARAEILVVGPEGVPVTGATVTLTSLEFTTPVTEWLEQGRIESSTGLTSSTNGRILLEGLPRGPYGWSIVMESGESAGSFTLEPGANTRTLQLR